jgi:hypothetical protein
MTQHKGLTLERLRSFTPDQRLLMIANEMQRALSSFAPEHESSLRLCYERTLRLTDLSIAATDRKGLRRELLRWRDLVAELYVGARDAERHRAALRALLLLSPTGAEQLRALAAL